MPQKIEQIPFVRDLEKAGVDGSQVLLTEIAPFSGYIKEVCLHFPDGCLSGDSLIITKDGQVKPISELATGEDVLCHNSAGKVLGVSEREYTEPIYRLKPLSCLDFLITPEHPVLAIKRDNILCSNPSHKRNNRVCQFWKCPSIGCKRKKQWNLEWIPAEKLQEGDIVTIKIPQEVNDLEYLPIHDLGISNYGDNRHKKIPEKIPVSKELLRLIGYYLAEGCIHKHGKNGHNYEVQFTVGGHEENLAEDIARCSRYVFGADCTSMPRGHALDVVLGGRIFTELFKQLCGEYAKEKRIHPLLMNLPPSKQMGIVEGFLAGDGYSIDSRRQKVLTTANKGLAYQLWILLLRNNIEASIAPNPHPLRKIDGRELQPAMVYQVYWTENPQHCRRYRLDGQLLTPIVRIDKLPFSGKVYNLTIPKYNSYVVNGIAVHNCNAIVDIRVGHGPKQFCPKEGFLALNDATPTYPFNEPVSGGNEEIWVEMVNGDSANKHAITVTVMLEGAAS
ncbi:hypothetical protein ES703_71065 [subsurface metagenome]